MTKRRRILLLSHAPDNPDGGASRVFHLLAGGLRDLDHEVRLLHLEDMRLPSGRLRRLAATRMMLPKFVSDSGHREGPETFDAIVAPSGLGYPLFRKLAASNDRPLLVNMIHGLAKYDHAANLAEAELGHWPVTVPYRLVTGRAQVRWDGLGMAASDVTVVQNLRDLSDARDALGEDSRLRLIPPAIHPELLEASRENAPFNARASGSILWFGTWEARKGAHHVPAAFHAIRQSHPQAALTIGGTGKSASEILASFSDSDRSSITVLGRLSKAEQASEFRRNSVFLFPSLSEGFGLALAEAMCFGLAAVSTSTAFGGDYLTDSLNARIVPPTSEHLARAVGGLIEDPVRSGRMAEMGRTIARSFTVERSAASYSQLFKEGPPLVKNASISGKMIR